MGVIVCATGNGDTSRIVQNRAVDIARRERKRLIFIHVVDVKRLGDLEEGLVPAAEMELAWLGQAVLRLARDRARRSGVDADIAIRYGQVQSSLEAFVREHDTDVLLLGQPTNDALLDFAHQVEEDTGVPVQLITTNQDTERRERR